jgi:hypothetical protein
MRATRLSSVLTFLTPDQPVSASRLIHALRMARMGSPRRRSRLNPTLSQARHRGGIPPSARKGWDHFRSAGDAAVSRDRWLDRSIRQAASELCFPRAMQVHRTRGRDARRGLKAGRDGRLADVGRLRVLFSEGFESDGSGGVSGAKRRFRVAPLTGADRVAARTAWMARLVAKPPRAPTTPRLSTE